MTSTSSEPGPVPNQPMMLALRIWLIIEVGFGVMSIVTIAASPSQTATNFAWPIRPDVTAALLGGFYLAAASFYILSVFTRRWENVRVFIIASALFSSTELLATFLHWDRFTIGSIPFNVWFVSYILPPPLFAFFYYWQQRRAVPIPTANDEPLPPALRLAVLIFGILLLAFAIVAFVFPASIVPLMPWTFSPLTLRAASGWVLALGVMNISVARENDRTRCRIVSPFFFLLLPAIAFELSRYPQQVNWSHPAVYVGTAVLVILFGLGIYLARGDWRKSMG